MLSEDGIYCERDPETGRVLVTVKQFTSVATVQLTPAIARKLGHRLVDLAGQVEEAEREQQAEERMFLHLVSFLAGNP